MVWIQEFNLIDQWKYFLKNKSFIVLYFYLVKIYRVFLRKKWYRRCNFLHLKKGYKTLKIWWRGESIFSSRLFHARCFVLIFSKTEIIQSSENFLSKNTRQISSKSFKLSNPVILCVRCFTRRKILSFNSLVYFLFGILRHSVET